MKIKATIIVIASKIVRLVRKPRWEKKENK